MPNTLFDRGFPKENELEIVNESVVVDNVVVNSKVRAYVNSFKVKCLDGIHWVISVPVKIGRFANRVWNAAKRYLAKCKPHRLVATTVVACAAADLAVDLAVGIGMPWLMPVGIAIVAAILLVGAYGTYKEYKGVVTVSQPLETPQVEVEVTGSFLSEEDKAALDAMSNENPSVPTESVIG